VLQTVIDPASELGAAIGSLLTAKESALTDAGRRPHARTRPDNAERGRRHLACVDHDASDGRRGVIVAHRDLALKYIPHA
jgi:hypothetical protein